MYYYLNYFFLFSIVGHLLETVMYKIYNSKLESGFLYGYWTPVYGFGVILIILISKYIFRKLHLKKYYEIVIYFFIITLILTIIEFIGGNVLEFIFHKSFWNYTDHRFNFGKYVSLDASLIWGVCSIIFLYLIKPWMDKFIEKIPKIITWILIILFIIDLVFTFINKSKLI